LLANKDSYDYYYIHDHLFSPVALENAYGTINWRYEYDAYGEPTIYNRYYSENDYPLFSYLFTGREADYLDDGSLKIQYNRNRSYDYTTGRWLQRDPIGVNPAGGKQNSFSPKVQYEDVVNIYLYVKNNPIYFYDAMGLKKCSPENAVKGEVVDLAVLCCMDDPYLKEISDEIINYPNIIDLITGNPGTIPSKTLQELIRTLSDIFRCNFGGWCAYIKVDQYVCMCRKGGLEWVKVTEGLYRPCKKGSIDGAYSDCEEALNALKSCIKEYENLIDEINRRRRRRGRLSKYETQE